MQMSHTTLFVTLGSKVTGICTLPLPSLDLDGKTKDWRSSLSGVAENVQMALKARRKLYRKHSTQGKEFNPGKKRCTS